MADVCTARFQRNEVLALHSARKWGDCAEPQLLRPGVKEGHAERSIQRLQGTELTCMCNIPQATCKFSNSRLSTSLVPTMRIRRRQLSLAAIAWDVAASRSMSYILPRVQYSETRQGGIRQRPMKAAGAVWQADVCVWGGGGGEGGDKGQHKLKQAQLKRQRASREWKGFGSSSYLPQTHTGYLGAEGWP